MDDLIKRDDAIDAIQFGITHAKVIDKKTGEVTELFKQCNEELQKAVERIIDLPSVRPKRGVWVRGRAYPHRIFCSVCYTTYMPNDEIPLWCSESYFNVPKKYCPACGAQMEVDEDAVD